MLSIFSLVAAAPDAFLSKVPETVPDPFDQVALLDRFEEALGSGQRVATEARLSEITEALAHTFASLPKNERGAIGTAGARYAIHRLFVQRHGWHVEGVRPDGDAWSSSSPVAALGDGVPEHVHDLLGERFGSRGLDLHEVAVLAATLENLIHIEAVQRLEATYRVFGMSTTSRLHEEDVETIVDSYMQTYVLGYNISQLSLQSIQRLRSRIDRVLPHWPQTRTFLRQVQQDLAPAPSALFFVRDGPATSSFSFEDVTRIVEAISERFGQHQDGIDCEDIQHKLLLLEEAGGTGRVKLDDFYASVRQHNFWQFREHHEFLKQAGILDDSEASTPRVIIPNYFNMRSNCFNPSSAFYAICCIDKCEALMDHVEGEIQAPQATPERLIGIVSALPSASVPANRTLSAELVRRLEEVAQHHGGVVPLHGRLFAQWMHFAYPRECSYPHIAGTTTHMSPAKWSEVSGAKHTLSEQELREYASRSGLPDELTADGRWRQEQGSQESQESQEQPGCDEETGTCMAMWRSEEELVDTAQWEISRAEEQRKQGSSWAAIALRAAALLGLATASMARLGDFVRRARAEFDGAGVGKPHKPRAAACFV